MAQHRQRWEIECAAQQSAGARQAVLLSAYTLLHRWMRKMAESEGSNPRRISLHNTAQHAIVGLLHTASPSTPGTLPQRLAHLLA